VGHTADGRQFFLTTPFDPGQHGADNSREFVALYVFDHDGRLLDAKIDALGSRERLDSAKANRVYEARLKELGEVELGRIEVEPFAIERFGTDFGLIADAPDGDGDIWWVTAEPGDYMAFSAPWTAASTTPEPMSIGLGDRAHTGIRSAAPGRSGRASIAVTTVATAPHRHPDGGR
jgi:hypothetical protein